MLTTQDSARTITLDRDERYSIVCALLAKARAHTAEAALLDAIADDPSHPAAVAAGYRGDAAGLRDMASRTLDIVERLAPTNLTR